MTDSLFIRACYNKPTERTPVWIMRQAGRYLPQYRALRSGHSFTEMYKTPELATEVTLQPVDILGVDAAILFSDILVVPEAMGMELRFIEGRGPVFSEPLRNELQVMGLKEVESNEALSFVMQAIKNLRRELSGRVPLIGFCGAPWTLATYMVEGGASRHYRHIKEWRFKRPDMLEQLLSRVTDALIDYCRAQMDAGVQALQIFDSWAGLLDEDGFEHLALKYVRKLIGAIRRPGVPLIYFPRGGMLWLEKLGDLGAEVIGLDWNIAPRRARELAAGRFALQGNLDPTALYAGEEQIRRHTLKMLEGFGRGRGHIANLGHGILPDIPVENARAFVETIQSESAGFRNTEQAV